MNFIPKTAKTLIRQIYWLISWIFILVRLPALLCLLVIVVFGHYAEWGYDWCDEKLPAPPMPKWLVKYYKKRHNKNNK